MALTRHRRHKRKGQKKTMMGGHKKRRSTRGKGRKMGRRSKRMRGGVLKQGDVFELSDDFGNKSRRLSFAYNPTSRHFPGVYGKCGEDGLVCNSDPTTLFTNDPTKLAAYNNFISVSNSLRGKKIYTATEKQKLIEANIQLKAAFGVTYNYDIAKYMTEEQLNNYIDAKQVFSCFEDEQTRAETINEEGGPMYDNYCNAVSHLTPYSGERKPNLPLPLNKEGRYEDPPVKEVPKQYSYGTPNANYTLIGSDNEPML